MALRNSRGHRVAPFPFHVPCHGRCYEEGRSTNYYSDCNVRTYYCMYDFRVQTLLILSDVEEATCTCRKLREGYQVIVRGCFLHNSKHLRIDTTLEVSCTIPNAYTVTYNTARCGKLLPYYMCNVHERNPSLTHGFGSNMVWVEHCGVHLQCTCYVA